MRPEENPRGPVPPADTPPAGKARRWPFWVLPGLVAGPVGVVLSIWLLPDFFVETILFVVVAALTAWGFLAVAEILHLRTGVPYRDPVIVALTPYVALPFVIRLWATYADVQLPAFLVLGSVLEFGLLTVGFALFFVVAIRTRHRMRVAGLVSGVAGALAFVVCLAGVVTTSDHATPASLFLFLLTAVIVAIALSFQRAVALWKRAEWKWLRTGPALAVAGTQLFDGVVTYLAVIDPLGLAPRDFQENIFLSNVILRTAGPAFPVLKWVLAILIAYAVDGRPAGTSIGGAVGRMTFYLTLITIGMAPALYSGLQLL